jgi:hypothetical protein
MGKVALERSKTEGIEMLQNSAVISVKRRTCVGALLMGREIQSAPAAAQCSLVIDAQEMLCEIN